MSWVLQFSHNPKAKHIAQTHTEKCASITKIFAYKLDNHALIFCWKQKSKFLGFSLHCSIYLLLIQSQTFPSIWGKFWMTERKYERRVLNKTKKNKGKEEQVSLIVKASSLANFNLQLFSFKVLLINRNNRWMLNNKTLYTIIK